MIPRYERVNGQRVRCFDSGPNRGADRYTVVYLDEWRHQSSYGCGSGDCKDCYGPRLYQYLGMNDLPFHPSYGIAQHGECVIGRHLGKRIAFANLPEDCRRAIEQDCMMEVSA